MSTMLDDCGNEIKVGDHVKVVALNSDRGAILGLTGAPGVVVGFGRTRVVVSFASRVGDDSVGSELLHIVKTVDGRQLRTWADVHAEQAAAEPEVIVDTFSADDPPKILRGADAVQFLKGVSRVPLVGDRVRLVFTDDSSTKLRPGDEGTVRRIRTVEEHRTLDVDWNSGSSLAMLIDEGDVVEVITG